MSLTSCYYKKQESAFEKQICPRKYKNINKMFSVFAFFFRINKNKTVKTMFHINVKLLSEMILKVMVTMIHIKTLTY